MRIFAKKTAPVEWDRGRLAPVIRSSICSGEKVAGFRDRESGRVQEVMLIRDERDLAEFRRKYGIEGPIETIY